MQRRPLSPPAHVYSFCTYSALVCQNVTLDVKHKVLGGPIDGCIPHLPDGGGNIAGGSPSPPNSIPGMHSSPNFLSTPLNQFSADYQPCGAAGGGADSPALVGTTRVCQLSLGMRAITGGGSTTHAAIGRMLYWAWHR